MGGARFHPPPPTLASGRTMIWPAVAVVVVSHRTDAGLMGCLQALASLDYPADRYRVMVVDNASPDGAVSRIAAGFPGVVVYRSDRNRGFAGGNNRGFRAADPRPDFFVTLNDDTAVTPAWLRELVRPAVDDPTVGLVTGKLWLMQDRLRLRLRGLPPAGPPWRASHDSAGPGWGGWWRPPDGPGLRATLDGVPAPLAVLGPADAPVLNLGLPVAPGRRPTTLGLTVTAGCGGPAGSLAVGVGEGAWQSIEGWPGVAVTLAIPPTAAIRPVVQNAGSWVSRDGRGHDRGAVGGPGYQYYDDDRGQYDHPEEVFAGCGASLLIRAALLDDVGSFDERYFMYYEDTDLSWRARLRGWRVVYAPAAVVRHAHRGSTGEWSDRFVYHTERNRLLLLAKLAPAAWASAQLTRSIAAAARAARLAGRPGGADPPPRRQALPRWRALASLLALGPGVLRSRAEIQARRRVPPAAIDRWFA